MKVTNNSSIMVICGGISSEREISLRNGNAVLNALQNKGYSNTVIFELNRDNASQDLTSFILPFTERVAKMVVFRCI